MKNNGIDAPNNFLIYISDNCANYTEINSGVHKFLTYKNLNILCFNDISHGLHNVSKSVVKEIPKNHLQTVADIANYFKGKKSLWTNSKA
jgi:hypothetical protein